MNAPPGSTRLLLLALAALALASARPVHPAPLACDLLFAGGRVVDGTGAPWFRADVCVAGDRIAAVGRARRAPRRSGASTRRGLVIAPGFIDMLGQSEYNVLVDPRAASKITQGITTEITGEGASIAPTNARMIAEGKRGLRALRRHAGLHDARRLLRRPSSSARPTINLGTLRRRRRRARTSWWARATAAPRRRSSAQMEAAVAQAMEEGAFGLSTSLQYVPDRFASTEEIIALAKVARALRRLATSRTSARSPTRIDQSLDEVFRDRARGASSPPRSTT